MATNILQVFIENRGVSWSIGGYGSWREFLTVILTCGVLHTRKRLLLVQK